MLNCFVIMYSMNIPAKFQLSSFSRSEKHIWIYGHYPEISIVSDQLVVTIIKNYANII